MLQNDRKINKNMMSLGTSSKTSKNSHCPTIYSVEIQPSC